MKWKNKYEALPDKELVVLMNRGKKDADLAFRVIYNRYSARIHAYCFRILNNREAAEDIFQETFVRFYRKANGNTETGSISGFLITIARNLCLNQKRRDKSTVSIEDFHLVVNGNEETDKVERQQIIRSAIDLLNFEYKEPLILRLYDGLSYKEIGEVCGISEDNARARVFRAKKKIKAVLEPQVKELF